MSTPAAKRRRVDAANAVLRKPFQSPVIRRPDAAEGTGAAPGTSSGTPNPTMGKRSLEEKEPHSSPNSPSVPRQQQQHPQPSQGQGLRSRMSRGALRQTRPDSPLPEISSTPGSAAKSGGNKTAPGAHASAFGPGVDDDGDGENPFIALVKAHKVNGQRDMIKDINKKLDTVKQAKKIEAASEAKPPGGPVDQELRDLIAKWKGASRLAADELFEVVKERVDNAGGAKAWKAMQQRQLEFYRGFDQESPTRSKAADGEGNGDDDEDGDEGGLARREVDYASEGEGMKAGGSAHGDSAEGEDEPEFDMALMLRSLNIDLSLLGYDEAEEKWID